MKKSLSVTLGVCLVCSILVSFSAVGLKSIQERNKKLDQLSNILEVADIDISSGHLEKIYADSIKPQLIRLSSGKVLQEAFYPEDITPATFKIKQVSKNPELTTPVDPRDDRAKIQRLPDIMPVYQVLDGDSVSKYIFLVYGKGLWSTMYGYLALDKDLQTIRGFTFYEHGETPGLGGEVDNPAWKRQWIGKQAFGPDGTLKIEVIKGKVDQESPDAIHQIDGLSGSTLTTRGVNNLIQFWLGDNGYGPFIENR